MSFAFMICLWKLLSVVAGKKRLGRVSSSFYFKCIPRGLHGVPQGQQRWQLRFAGDPLTTEAQRHGEFLPSPPEGRVRCRICARVLTYLKSMRLPVRADSCAASRISTTVMLIESEESPEGTISFRTTATR